MASRGDVGVTELADDPFFHPTESIQLSNDSMKVQAKLILAPLFALLVSPISIFAQDSVTEEPGLFEEDRVREIVEADEQTNDDAEPTDANEKTDKKESLIPPARTEYMNRRIARTMHYKGAEWLIRDEREREERCSLMVANLGVKNGMTICDLGCGNGFHTLTLAKMVGPTGRIVGVDVQPEMLGFLRERMEEQGIENVIPILGSYHNPHLPPNSIDMILMVDVYHEFSHPELMLVAMRRALKSDGVIVLAEYRAEDPKVPIKPLHKMSKKQVDKELTANGFRLVRSFDKLPWQHLLFYGIDQEYCEKAND